MTAIPAQPGTPAEPHPGRGEPIAGGAGEASVAEVTAAAVGVPPQAPTVRSRRRDVLRRNPWAVWSVGVSVYLLAVFHRMSLGVAGPLATSRLDLSAAQLGTFVMLQLGVYATMQVPAGILIDRYGPRRMLLTAVLIMGSAQVLLSVAHHYPTALAARGLLGCGDAMTYVSVLRLASGWFPPRRYPTMAALSGLVGMIGNLVSTVPLTFLLTNLGWTVTFAAAGGLTLAVSVLLLRPAAPAPYRTVGSPRPRPTAREIRADVVATWRLPAERMALWTHLCTMAGPTAFAALWGFPYLTQALGYTPGVASSLLLMYVLVGVVTSLGQGPLLSRRPAIRGGLAAAVAAACLLGWVTLIAWPDGTPPTAVVMVVIIVFGIGGPASGVGFLVARDYNPAHRISTATGMVNVGGFTGAVIMVLAIGQILDVAEPGALTHTAAAYRWAFSAVAVVTAFGLFRMLTWLHRTRAGLLQAVARGEDIPVPITPHRWDRVHALDPELIAAELDRHRTVRRLAGSTPTATRIEPGPPGGTDRP